MKTHLDFLRCNAMQMRCDAKQHNETRCDATWYVATSKRLWPHCDATAVALLRQIGEASLAVARKLEYEVKRRSWSLLTIYLSSLDVSVIRRLKIKVNMEHLSPPISLELCDERLAINKLLFQNKWLLFQNKLLLNSILLVLLKTVKTTKGAVLSNSFVPDLWKL